jgi:hypothetical protein
MASVGFNGLSAFTYPVYQYLSYSSMDLPPIHAPVVHPCHNVFHHPGLNIVMYLNLDWQTAPLTAVVVEVNVHYL